QLSDQDHAERAAVADDARQALRPAAAGQDPEPDLRLSEPGRTGRDPEVARERELAPAAERVPVDLRDRRLRELGEDLEDPAPVHGIALLEGRALGEFGDVRARNEGAVAFAREDDDAHA